MKHNRNMYKKNKYIFLKFEFKKWIKDVKV